LCSGKDAAWTDLLESFTAAGFIGRIGLGKVPFMKLRVSKINEKFS